MALAELEADALAKLEINALIRCGNGLFGESWIGQGFFSGKSFKRSLLLHIYKLVTEDANPSNKNKLIIRHQMLGIKAPLSMRYDEFIYANPKKNKICTKWSSTGFVDPRLTKILTKEGTHNPYHRQRLKIAPYRNNVLKKCPLIKESFCCLWLFCPIAC